MINSPPPQVLTFEDARHAQASEGWLVLGDLNEAHAELDQISPEGQKHPFALEVRWRIHSVAKNWDACLKISEALIELILSNHSTGSCLLTRSVEARLEVSKPRIKS